MQGLLWDDGSNDLAVELTRNEKQEDNLTLATERLTSRPEDWLPDPREADPSSYRFFFFKVIMKYHMLFLFREI